MTNKITLAGCIILDKEGRILLLHRNTPARVQWETPGGKIEDGEDSKTAAKREIKEELGIVVDILHEIGRKEFVEDEEREFWWKLDLSEYVEPSDFERVKEKANEINIPYQSLIKQYIKKGVFSAN